MDPKLRSKCCNPNMDLELTLPHDLWWDINWTGARDGVQSQKVQHKYQSGTGSTSRGWPPTWYKVRHGLNWSQRWSGPSKGTTQIWIKTWSWCCHPKNWLQFGTYMVIKTLGGRCCKKGIISTSATYIWHTHEKVKKKMEFTAGNEIDQY